MQIIPPGTAYWCMCEWEEDFTGYVVDYGTFPDQRRAWFTLENAPRTLGRTFPGAGTDGAIQAGLEALVRESLAREWPRAGRGGVLRIEKCLVDMGYKPGIVAAVKHKVGGATMVLSKGVGIRAGYRTDWPSTEIVSRPVLVWRSVSYFASIVSANVAIGAPALAGRAGPKEEGCAEGAGSCTAFRCLRPGPTRG